MTGPRYGRAPRTFRVSHLRAEDRPGPQWRGPDEPAPERNPLLLRPASPDAARHDFANLVVRMLVDAGVEVAVIAEHGRPAVVRTSDHLYSVLAKDHDIVGVYKAGARVRDVIEDLKAAGL